MCFWEILKVTLSEECNGPVHNQKKGANIDLATWQNMLYFLFLMGLYLAFNMVISNNKKGEYLANYLATNFKIKLDQSKK